MNSLKLTWQQCADLPQKCWVSSVAELDGKVYISTEGGKRSHNVPLAYDPDKDQWFSLPKLPTVDFSLVSISSLKQLLAIGGLVTGRAFMQQTSNAVFLWDDKNEKWLTPYPNMPTARSSSSAISYRSMIIVAGGMGHGGISIKRTVEILQINENHFPDSQWSVVTQLPYSVYSAVPVIIDNNLYIANGFSANGKSTCNIITVPVKELLQSSGNSTNKCQVWKTLPEMPYSSWSINHYQGCLVIFTGDQKVKQRIKSTWQLISQIHFYNPDTHSWDYLKDIPYNYLVGRSIRVRENKLLFIGGITGTHTIENADDTLTTCLMLMLNQS